MKISIVVPLFNEAGNILALAERLRRVIEQNPEFQWEVIFVNDGSTDRSDWLLSGLATKYRWLTVIDLSRNFGHQNAITAEVSLGTQSFASTVCNLYATLCSAPRSPSEQSPSCRKVRG